ncbi:MAG TPA: hypothetical protein VNH18_15870 [Bryobacteraceae bacterium]|nr:hypothetical protein [Bryobacteraceae bacterium]
MDLSHVIQELIKERNHLDVLIRALEKGLSSTVAPKKPRSRRGRKSMAPEERLQVADRMKRYWAARKGVGASDLDGLNGAAWAVSPPPEGKIEIPT